MPKEEKLKDLLREVLPLIQEFIGEGYMEEEPIEVEEVPEMEYSEVDEEGFEADEYGMNEELEDDKEMRKRISAAAISKNIGSNKKKK